MTEWNAEAGAFVNKLFFHRRSKDCLPGEGDGEMWHGYTPMYIPKNWRRLLSIEEKKLKKMQISLESDLGVVLIMTGHAELYEFTGVCKRKKIFKRRTDLEAVRRKLLIEEENLLVPLY